MFRALLLGVCGLAALAPNAGAAPPDCASHFVSGGGDLLCEQRLVARAQPHRWTYRTVPVVDGFASSWKLRGRVFLTGSSNRRCVAYGRYAGVRVREFSCADSTGPLTIAYRSFDGPVPLVFEFQVWR